MSLKKLDKFGLIQLTYLEMKKSVITNHYSQTQKSHLINSNNKKFHSI